MRRAVSGPSDPGAIEIGFVSQLAQFAKMQFLVVCTPNVNLMQRLSFVQIFECQAAFDVAAMRFGEAGAGATVIDLTPLTINNCLMSLLRHFDK